jgi:hypothetical protein
MPHLPNRAPPGAVAPLTAESFNALLEAVAAALNIQVGPGLTIKRDGSGATIALVGREDGPFRCFVEAVDPGPSATPAGESVPSEVRYTVRVPERPNLPAIAGLQPTIGRIFHADEALCIPAKVGDSGVVWRVKLDPATNEGAAYAWRLALQEGAPLEEDCGDPPAA